MTFNLRYLWLAARLKVFLFAPLPPPRARFGGVTFTLESHHYQLRRVMKDRSIQPVLACLLSLCNQQTLCLDIGANVGLFSLLIAAHTGAKVLAIEPVRGTFKALVRNCGHNSHLDISPLNLALGSCTASVKVTAMPGCGTNQVEAVAERMDWPLQWTPQISLDQLDVPCMMSTCQRLVIKIDVERYEFEVLKGARELLGANLPIALCVEVNPHQLERLEALLDPAFKIFSPDPVSTLAVTKEDDRTNFFFANTLFLNLYFDELSLSHSYSSEPL